MTAEEIRNLVIDDMEDGPITTNTDGWVEDFQNVMLREIAAQLAEIAAELRKLNFQYRPR